MLIMILIPNIKSGGEQNVRSQKKIMIRVADLGSIGLKYNLKIVILKVSPYNR